MSNYQILTGQGLIQIVYLGVNNILQILEETSSNEILRLSIKDLKAPILFNSQNNRIPIKKMIESMEFHIAAIRNNGNIWWERNYNGYTRFILQNQHEEKLRDIQIKNSEVFSWIFGNTELFVCTMTATELKIIAQ
jgi:hypothetical protein